MTTSFADDFIEVTTAEAAVDRLAELYEQATRSLRAALKQYLADRQLPPDSHCNFCYPELRLTYRVQGEAPSSIRAYARLQEPGVYSMTVTQPEAFRRYLENQLGLIMRDFEVTIEVGRSRVNIP
ncbi:MAG: AMP nucleosidase, partial [Alteromonadaceae bacterium]|nr:AMP nucleosidase [Alteromonadaceae bacterium]